MCIGFDNDRRLRKRVYYFTYNNVRFKLIQTNPKKWRDLLLTVVENDDASAKTKAYAAASEFLSAFAWEHDARVKAGRAGGFGRGKKFNLRSAKARAFTFPEMPLYSYSLGYDISRIAHLENDKQKLAVALFREANSSNSSYLSFLFYWQIMEIDGTHPMDWVNKTYRNRSTNHFFIEQNVVGVLNLKSQSIGHYFEDSCRHAIAHIKRKPGETTLRFNDFEDEERLEVSSNAVKRFAKFYITQQLGLKKQLYLVRQRNGKGFPFYATGEQIRNHLYKGCS